MNVSQIRDRIVQISHNEDAPDTALRSKALDWLNSAYHELIDDLMPLLERHLRRQVTLTVTAGEALLPADAYRLLRVRDPNTNRLYKEQAFTRLNTQEVATAPHTFRVEGQKLVFGDSAPATVEVTYLPSVPDLAETDTAEAILLPRQFHSALVWGGLVWSAIYERGLSSQTELALFQQKWDEAKQRVRQSLGTRPTYERPAFYPDFV
jgi:hypothetical protein